MAIGVPVSLASSTSNLGNDPRRCLVQKPCRLRNIPARQESTEEETELLLRSTMLVTGHTRKKGVSHWSAWYDAGRSVPTTERPGSARSGPPPRSRDFDQQTEGISGQTPRKLTHQRSDSFRPSRAMRVASATAVRKFGRAGRSGWRCVGSPSVGKAALMRQRPL